MCDTQFIYRLPNIYIHAEVPQRFFSLPEYRRLIDKAANPHRLPAKDDVLTNREMRNQVEFLMDARNAGLLGLSRVLNVDRMTVKSDFACVLLVCAAQNLYQGRFSRAVLAKQHVDFTPAKIEVHAIQSDQTRKAFPDMTHRQNGSGFTLHRNILSFLRAFS